MGAITAELVESTEKRDIRGRRLGGEERRLAMLAEYDRSGLTQRAFAAREGLRYHTLVTWLVRRRREQAPRTPSRDVVRFAQVRMPRLRSGMEICLPNGIVIRGADAREVAVLVKILGR